MATAALLQVLSWQGIFLAPNFIPSDEIHLYQTLGNNLRNALPSLGLLNRGNLTEANFIDQLDQPLPHYAKLLEERITNVTGIPYHRDETALLFTRQVPLHVKSPSSSVNFLHHDKNGRIQRSVTCLIYLTTTKEDKDGGHTIFPAIPKGIALMDPLKSMTASTTSTSRYNLPNGWRQPASTTKIIAQRLAHGFQQGHRHLTDGSYGNKRDLWDRTAFKLVEKECVLARTGKNRGLAIRPKAGDAVFFWSSHADGRPNLLAWHTACVAIGGESREAIQKFKEPVRENERTANYGIHDDAVDEHVEEERNLEL